ncbi:MAG TPA: hypothetical protein VK665_19130 [Candidatus Elarobacter sp.]|nr:hypothetical protein [Candidatus Elarobacter sp.]
MLAALLVAIQHTPQPAPAAPSPSTSVPPIDVALYAPPTDIPGGAASASIQQAGAFAWQEFIALNWPAVKQTGGMNQRDVPDAANCAFADPKCNDRLRVWETYRGKVEIFPGMGNPPGYATPPPSTPNWSYGYDALPQYNYSQGLVSGPCTGTPPPQAAFVNLDETDEIGLDSMYSGEGPLSSSGNADPQLVRFLAKANRTEYVYVARHAGWWLGGGPGGAPLTSTIDYVMQNGADPSPNNDTYVSFPSGTIEVKAGWRPLGPLENPTRFHTQRVRFYENGSSAACYREQTWALAALHIIQKTPSAPYFVYATFEQTDNIRTPRGADVENDDGAVVQPPSALCPAGQTYPCPTTPRTQFVDAPSPQPNSAVPPQVVLNPTTASYCTASFKQRPKYQLYYANQIGPVPRQGFICVNHRAQLIPPPIVAVNRAAHAAIAAYAAKHGFGSGPWAHYKLVNVQYVPVDKTYAGYFRGSNPNNYDNPASYYLANSVVETNTVLQTFSGGLTPFVRSDYQYHFWLGDPSPRPTPPPSLTQTHKQVFYGGTGHDMGGCMGCHGSQGQDQGGNFSVIMARGPVSGPEIPHSPALRAARPRLAASLTSRAAQIRNRHLIPDKAP